MPAKYYVDDEFGRRSVQTLDEYQARELNATPVDEPEKADSKPSAAKAVESK